MSSGSYLWLPKVNYWWIGVFSWKDSSGCIRLWDPHCIFWPSCTCREV